jgi:ubiquinone/menaquinone biosynthesis C-methylase UbiE
MIRRDIDAARSLGFTDTTFFVGDGDHPPLKEQSFDYVHTVGALHHLPDPARTIKEIQRILVPGGMHFASENNRSMFRGIFDLLMKIHPLWIEEAGAEPTMSRKMFDDWCRTLPVTITSQTSIFLPPHLVNLFNVDVAERLVSWSDRFFSRVPIMRSHGGILFVTITKLPA